MHESSPNNYARLSTNVSKANGANKHANDTSADMLITHLNYKLRDWFPNGQADAAPVTFDMFRKVMLSWKNAPLSFTWHHSRKQACDSTSQLQSELQEAQFYHQAL